MIKYTASLRHEIGISQATLAARAQITKQCLGRYETGNSTPTGKIYDRLMREVLLAKQEYDNTATHGDSIRKMNDEELVFMIACPTAGCAIRPDDRDCYACKLKWLGSKGKIEYLGPEEETPEKDFDTCVAEYVAERGQNDR